MCLSMMRDKSTPVSKPTVNSDVKKKKPTLLNQRGGGRDKNFSPTSSVNTGTQGLSGRDSFGNMEGRSSNRGDGMRSGYR